MRTAALWMALMTLSNLATAVTLEPDRPVLDLPISGKKLVLAHYMTEFLLFKGNDKDLFLRPDLYDPDGPSAKFGGIFQYQAMQPLVASTRDLSMKEAAAWEMRAALKLGIDGFQFYYPNVLDNSFHRRYVDTIKAFFKAADEQQIDFKLTLCLSLPRQGTEDQKIEKWALFIKYLLAETAGSDKWAKTPDGRHLMYLYAPDPLADELGGKTFADQPEEMKAVAEAYERLAQACGIDIAWIYPLRDPARLDMVNAAMDYFPAFWDWIDVDPAASEASWQAVAALARQRKRAYTQSVHSDYYGSKVYDRSGEKPKLIYRLEDILAKDAGQLMRDCEPTQLSAVFRLQLERAISLDVPLINYITWNDFPEGHHISPEINHNFGFPSVLKHYKAQWLKQAPEGGERAVLFYKKYAHTLKPSPYAVPYRLKMSQHQETKDDFIDVVSILDAPAELWFKGRLIGPLPAGLASTLIPAEPGAVAVELRREGKAFLTLAPPEAITDAPYRTDRLTYAWSSDGEAVFKELFGEGALMPVSDEYAVDKKGVPNWKKRYKFAKD